MFDDFFHKQEQPGYLQSHFEMLTHLETAYEYISYFEARAWWDGDSTLAHQYTVLRLQMVKTIDSVRSNIDGSLMRGKNAKKE